MCLCFECQVSKGRCVDLTVALWGSVPLLINYNSALIGSIGPNIVSHVAARRVREPKYRLRPVCHLHGSLTLGDAHVLVSSITLRVLTTTTSQLLIVHKITIIQTDSTRIHLIKFDSGM